MEGVRLVALVAPPRVTVPDRGAVEPAIGPGRVDRRGLDQEVRSVRLEQSCERRHVRLDQAYRQLGGEAGEIRQHRVHFGPHGEEHQASARDRVPQCGGTPLDLAHHRRVVERQTAFGIEQRRSRMGADPVDHPTMPPSTPSTCPVT